MQHIIETDNLDEFIAMQKNIEEEYPNILMLCCQNKAWNIAEYVLSKYNTNLDIVDDDGNTLLMYSLYYERYDFALMLIDYGFNLFSHRNNSGRMCLNFLRPNDHKIHHILLDKILTNDKKKKEEKLEFKRYGDLSFTIPINSGTYGDVFYDHDNSVMIKSSKISGSFISDDMIKEFITLRIINLVNPKIAVYLKGIYYFDNKLNMILEDLEYDLNDLFDIYSKVNIESKRIYFKLIYKTIIELVDKLNNIGIIHRDLKPNNIMIDNMGNVRIIDFGLMELAGIGRSPQKFTGTVNYVAPEFYSNLAFRTSTDIFNIKTNEHGYSSDMFSVASIIVYSILQRDVCLFFNGDDIYEYNQTTKNMINGKTIFTLKKLSKSEIAKFNDFSPDLLPLLSCMFETDSRLRYSAKECLKHKFFTDSEYTTRPIFQKKINSIDDNDFFSCDDILLNRKGLIYGYEIYDFYTNCVIPKTNISEHNLELLKRMQTKEITDASFNNNVFRSSFCFDITPYVYDRFYGNSITTITDKSIVIFTLEKILESSYIPISITSIIEFYVSKLRETTLSSSLLKLIRSTLYNKFMELSLSIRENDILVSTFIYEIISDLSSEKDIPILII